MKHIVNLRKVDNSSILSFNLFTTLCARDCRIHDIINPANVENSKVKICKSCYKKHLLTNKGN